MSQLLKIDWNSEGQRGTGFPPGTIAPVAQPIESGNGEQHARWLSPMRDVRFGSAHVIDGRVRHFILPSGYPAVRGPKMSCLHHTRRAFGAMAVSLGALSRVGISQALAVASGLPAEVAGITLPRSELAIRAARFAQLNYPPFLYNHCLRTFLFGALALREQRRSFNAEDAFAASALHDLGLLPTFASKTQSFEVDGANAAQSFAKSAGSSSPDLEVIWRSVALHDVRFAIVQHAGPEAMLVAMGAGSDVDGPDLQTDDQRKQMAEIVAAFPRLQFKKAFASLLADHCRRKPTSQQGTWLGGFCRERVSSAERDSVMADLEKAPFSE